MNVIRSFGGKCLSLKLERLGIRAAGREEAVSQGWRNEPAGGKASVLTGKVTVWIHTHLLSDLGKSPYPLWAVLPSVQQKVWI